MLQRFQLGLQLGVLRAQPLRLAVAPPQFELGHDVIAENPQRAFMRVGKFARPTIDYAQRAECVSFRIDQRRTGIEADLGVSGHQWIAGEACIGEGILDDQGVRLQDGVCAERDIAFRLLGVDTLSGLEPLAVLIDQ